MHFLNGEQPYLPVDDDRFNSTAKLYRALELLRNPKLLHTFHQGRDSWRLEYEDSPDGPSFYHCRMTREDGHLAVCSPVWVQKSDER